MWPLDGGNSVVREVRAFLPQHLWKNVIVGCYGGASIARLDDDGAQVPTQDQQVFEASIILQTNLKGSDLHFDLNPQLLSIRPSPTVDLHTVRNTILENVRDVISAHRVVQSAHSIDILGSQASKLRVLESVIEHTQSKDNESVLRIGDQGAWGGNDYELLASGPSLSVDRVSADFRTCWNISSPGHRSTVAAAGYLKTLRRQKHSFRFRVNWARFSF